ncbi:UvrD-helicase domain-containing protein [Montanilutibacter psychrotolerans]|uniref:RecBCD enzyme subunit RecB n=1 Tax=Montanilutibacter psychrotolerans TaxID=1327343 RepID=A0A3M8SS92_9GAMM|nr:exodeoxyribonuclease V subunit beta [Lysobacter psychrotolerans]RNF83643.1 exodeoxyribonuclease V subunit beta [Lysobacter psychrotolerans]
MNLAAAPLDPADAYLDIALDGVQLIEASAGTGKTFTLATLVTRLVVERGLRLGEILAVTFTEAATQELRARLRKRLVLAADIAGRLVANPDDDGDPVAVAADDPETTLTAQIIRRQLLREDGASLRARLRRAEHEIDLAATFTIHGFCARVLTEHTLQTGQAFAPPTLVGSERDLHDELAADLWRTHGAQAHEADLLHVLWSGPDALAQDLGALMRAARLLPARPVDSPDPRSGLQQSFENLLDAHARHGEQARTDLDGAIAAKHIDGRKARPASYDKAWDALATGLRNGRLAHDDDHLDKLTPVRLRECAKAGSEERLPHSPLFDALAQWLQADRLHRQWLAEQALRLLHHIRQDASLRLAELKRSRRLQSYDDLIDGVADALCGPHGDDLARQLRAQYAIALVDEFQDTDTRQWAIFRRVFGHDGDRATDADLAALSAEQRDAIDHDPTVAVATRGADPSPGHATPARSSPASDAVDATHLGAAHDHDTHERGADADAGTMQSNPTQSKAAGRDANAPPALFLIGDPKQAIYGFRGGDVHTYLAARATARIAPPLAHNFRSRPSVLRAIQALYEQAGPAAFVDERIGFRAVEPGAGTSDADYQRDGQPAPALVLRVLPGPGGGRSGKSWSAPESRDHATAACVAEIHAVLGDARAGRALIGAKPVQPADIAVLVRSHSEAARVQAALVAAGVPAVAAGKQSLFASDQAGEALAVLEALLQPADEGRLRAALSTVLLGVDAAGIDRLDHDDDARRARQLQVLAWRERWQRHGPLALLSDLCATNAERLLDLLDGERRLTNLMQLGELLQQAAARALGMPGQVDWLRGRIAEADPNDEQQLLRLESDARRVQILTLHKSKGLEFGLVFLPFVGIGRRDEKPSRQCQLPGEDGRVLHWKLGRDDDSSRWSEAVAASEREQRAEDARLLYVGLTRARHALWLAHGPLFRAEGTALAPMLAGLDGLRGDADIVIDESPLPGPLPALPPPPAEPVPNARQARRVLPRDWWVYSFTQLSQAHSGDPGDGGATTAAALAGERRADDEPELAALAGAAVGAGATSAGAGATTEDAGAPDTFDRRFGGSRFGNVLHDALEHVDFAAWRHWRGGAAPAGEHEPLRAALRAGGYADADLDDGVAELTHLVGQTLTVELPEGGRLCELPGDARRAELEFHFALQPTSVDALLALLHAHGVLRERQAFGARHRLEGLMTGKIDLTYANGGRWYVLDYKSNRLPAYDAASLASAMAHSEYDLQALIYTVALHRWLRFRLGDAYDYARDFGGVRYLFCRGLDAGSGSAAGVHADTPAVELIDALDNLFAGRGSSGPHAPRGGDA